MGAFTMGMQREGMNTRLVCVRASTITCPSLPPSLLPSLPPLPSGHNAVLHACTVEDEAFVGIGATLLDGVVVESGAMVAAGSLVLANTRVPSGQVRGALCSLLVLLGALLVLLGALLVLLGALLLGQSASSLRAGLHPFIRQHLGCPMSCHPSVPEGRRCPSASLSPAKVP